MGVAAHPPRGGFARGPRRGQRGAHMAVLVQQMLIPDVSFILMTRHPMTNDPNTAYAELALGHGETLASGSVRGTPWRMSMNRSNPGESQVHTYSSFGTALVPDLDGDGTLKSVAVNCAGHWLSTDDGARGQLAARLVHAGGFVESTLGSGRRTTPRAGYRGVPHAGRSAVGCPGAPPAVTAAAAKLCLLRVISSSSFIIRNVYFV